MEKTLLQFAVENAEEPLKLWELHLNGGNHWKASPTQPMIGAEGTHELVIRKDGHLVTVSWRERHV